MNLRKQLERTGALITDLHFVYAKGGHGPDYIDKRKLFPDPVLLEALAFELLGPFEASDFDTVMGPAAGAIPLAFICARRAAEQRPVSFVWADKNKQDKFELDPAYLPHVENKRVLIVEDILNSGGSAAEVCQLTRDSGGDVVGVSALVNRGSVTAEDIGVPELSTLLEVSLDNYPPQDCPLCQEGITIITRPGHGYTFQENFPNYHGGYTELSYLL